MRKFKIMSLLLAVVMLVAAISPAASAATVENATIDMEAKGSITIYKYDFTNAQKDGVWDTNSFVSTGEYEQYVNDTLGNAVRKGDSDGKKGSTLGNGESSNGYAIKGVEFTYLRVADIAQFTQVVDEAVTTVVLYGFDKTASADLLSAIGLADGTSHYEPADTDTDLSNENYWYTSDVINKALSDALANNSTTVKKALEDYVAAQGGTKMKETDENGYTTTEKKTLELGLYLLVETKVPEMVTSTVNPFFVSVPMTSVNGGTDGNGADSQGTEGGTEWIYDITVYPKDETGLPTLEKTVRESAADGGHNEGSDSITDGYSHTATGSAGDVMEYQTISAIPTITSDATAISYWQFFDTLSEGLSYQKSKKDVKIQIYSDEACTELVDTWTQDDGNFTVNYSQDDRTMTVDVTTAGLAKINGSSVISGQASSATTYGNVNGNLYQGYSNYYMRLTYTAKINSDSSLTLGDEGNGNKVVLTWKRTSTVDNGSDSDYYDTLIDDAHVYVFGIDLTKTFKDMDTETAESKNAFESVTFKIYNNTDGYYIKAERDEDAGVYYMTGRAKSEKDATAFYPMTSGDNVGQIIVWGLEDDEYVLTELTTYNGYTLLKEQIHVTITAAETDEICDIYSEDVLGLLQNDPRYSFGDVALSNIPQTQLEHKLMSATATVRTDSAANAADAKMGEDDDSENALAELTIVNTPGSDLPATGDIGTMIFSAAGVCVLAFTAFAFIIFFVTGKRRKDEDEA